VLCCVLFCCCVQENVVMKIPVDGELDIGDRDGFRNREMFFEALGVRGLGSEHLGHLVAGLQRL
jgi:hypothetical protein